LSCLINIDYMCNFILIDIEDIVGNLNQLLWFLSSLFIQSLHQHDFYGIVRQGAHLNLVRTIPATLSSLTIVAYMSSCSSFFLLFLSTALPNQFSFSILISIRSHQIESVRLLTMTTS
jgi:hypothetical protein